MTQADKKTLKKQWREQQKRKYILSMEEVTGLFDFLGERLEEEGCDDTPRFTHQWLNEHIPEGQHAAVLAEMEEMGGFCDCEVLMNCYEDYDIDA